MQSQTQKFLSRRSQLLQSGRLGLLGNQTAWDIQTGEYLYQSLIQRGNLRRIFIPEHGLFAELQDQIPLDQPDYYGLPPEVEAVSLYGSFEESLTARPQLLEDLDALVVDIQDVGSRYYTFAVTVSYIFTALSKLGSKLPVYIIDRPNPAGRQVEGSPLNERFTSFVGRAGIPHRHGLTIGELSRLFYKEEGCEFPLEIIPLEGLGESSPDWDVAPSPNMPTRSTARVYSGQCLLEGTNLSEGRGTTRPFEMFGADWIDSPFTLSPPEQGGARLRPLYFQPAFHKYKGLVCGGWQIHLTGQEYHSLAHSLRLIRYVRETYPEQALWRRGAYEYRSDRPAIHLLAGDELLLDYLEGRESYENVQGHLREAQAAWLRYAGEFLLYERPLYSAEP